MEAIALGIQNAVLALAPAAITVAIIGAMVVGAYRFVEAIIDDNC